MYILPTAYNDVQVHQLNVTNIVSDTPSDNNIDTCTHRVAPIPDNHDITEHTRRQDDSVSLNFILVKKGLI